MGVEPTFNPLSMIVLGLNPTTQDYGRSLPPATFRRPLLGILSNCTETPVFPGIEPLLNCWACRFEFAGQAG